MRKIICAILATLMLLLIAVPVLADNLDDLFDSMYVNCANGKTLNLRDAPNGKVIGRLDNGTKVWISGGFIEKGWVAVTVRQKDGKTIDGFVKNEFLQSKKPGKYEITEREDNFKDVEELYIVTAKALNAKTDNSVGLREKPNKTSHAFRRLQAGDQLLVLAAGNTWLKVQYLGSAEEVIPDAALFEEDFNDAEPEIGYVANDYMIFDHIVKIPESNNETVDQEE